MIEIGCFLGFVSFFEADTDSSAGSSGAGIGTAAGHDAEEVGRLSVDFARHACKLIDRS